MCLCSFILSSYTIPVPIHIDYFVSLVSLSISAILRTARNKENFKQTFCVRVIFLLRNTLGNISLDIFFTISDSGGFFPV